MLIKLSYAVWDEAMCLTDMFRHFRGTCCLYHGCLYSWLWKKRASLVRVNQSTKLHGIISNKTNVFVITVVITSYLSVVRVQVVIKYIFDIQEYRCSRYLEQHDQRNSIALQFLPHSKQATIFVAKISRLMMFAKIRNLTGCFKCLTLLCCQYKANCINRISSRCPFSGC